MIMIMVMVTIDNDGDDDNHDNDIDRGGYGLQKISAHGVVQSLLPVLKFHSLFFQLNIQKKKLKMNNLKLYMYTSINF